MLTAITEQETFDRDGKQFTRQSFKSGTTTINLIRPVLTPEEYETRRMAIEKAAIELLKSTMKNEINEIKPLKSQTFQEGQNLN